MDDARTTPLPYADIESLPGPKAWPLLGNLPDIELPRIHQQLETLAREYGPLFRVKLGRKIILCVPHLPADRQIPRARPPPFHPRQPAGPGFSPLSCQGLWPSNPKGKGVPKSTG